jgi:hypothetical protein
MIGSQSLSFVVFASILAQAMSQVPQDLCYKLYFGYDQTGSQQDSNSYSFYQLVQPIKKWPFTHPKVTHGVCGGAVAEDYIPEGIDTCTDCKWSNAGQTSKSELQIAE